jgi:hypothetical protein
LDNEGLNTQIIKKQFIRLLEKKKKLEPQYNELKGDIDNLNKQIAGLDQALLAAGIDTSKIRKKVYPPKPLVESVRKEDTIPDLIYKMLVAYKKPLHYKEIHRQLHTGGFWIKGKDPANTVLAYITRNKDRFMKAPEVGRGFYKIRE